MYKIEMWDWTTDHANGDRLAQQFQRLMEVFPTKERFDFLRADDADCYLAMAEKSFSAGEELSFVVYYMSDQDQQVVSMAVVEDIEEDCEGRKYSLLSYVTTEKKFRERGYATALLDHVKNNHRWLILEVERPGSSEEADDRWLFWVNRGAGEIGNVVAPAFDDDNEVSESDELTAADVCLFVLMVIGLTPEEQEDSQQALIDYYNEVVLTANYEVSIAFAGLLSHCGL
jgi:GNAT superfamily N-acetyltransferase